MPSPSTTTRINTLLVFLIGLMSGMILGYILGPGRTADVQGRPAAAPQLNDVLSVEDVWIVEGLDCPAPGCTNPLRSCQSEVSRRIRDWINSQRRAGRPGESIRTEIIRVHGSRLFDVSPAGFTIVYKVVGKGTKELSRVVPGDELDVLGPLGNGFSVLATATKHILVGGGVGVAPLVFLANTLVNQRDRAGGDVRVIAGFRCADDVICVDVLRGQRGISLFRLPPVPT